MSMPDDYRKMWNSLKMIADQGCCEVDCQRCPTTEARDCLASVQKPDEPTAEESSVVAPAIKESLKTEKPSSPCDECKDKKSCEGIVWCIKRDVPHTREKPAEEQLMICLNARGCDSCCYGTGPHKKTLDCKDHLCSKTGKQISCIPYTPTTDTTEKYLDDGFGSRCSITCLDCGQDTMEIVRPGKFQCTNCNNETKETGKDL